MAKRRDKSVASQLSKLCDGLNTTFGEGTIGQGVYPPVSRVSTGSLSLDIEIGGGWPLARTVHVYGDPSSGKSLVASKAIQQYQQAGHLCARVEMERTDDKGWDETLGIDTDQLIRATPQSAENAIDVIAALLRSHESVGIDPPGLIVVDSVALMVPTYTIEHSADDHTMGLHARLMSRLMQKVGAAMATRPGGKPHYTTVMLLNQTRTRISSNPRIPSVQDPTGGRAILFGSSISVRLKALEMHDAKGKATKSKGHEANLIAQTTGFVVEKNKTFPPRRTGQFTFFIDGPRAGQIDDDAAIMDYAIKYGVVEQNGAWFTYRDIRSHGKDALVTDIQEAGLFEEIKTRTIETATSRIADHAGEVVFDAEGELQSVDEA